MSIWKKDDSFLARWLDNSLEPEEQTQFEESAEFREFEQIIGAVDELKTPKFDQDSSFATLQKRIQSEKT